MKRSVVVSFLVLCVAGFVYHFRCARPALAEDAQAPSYVGPDACKKCHLKQFKSWQKTAMAHSWEMLQPGQAVEKKTAGGLDANTDYTKDVKCLKCHTTAYGAAGGYPEVVAGKEWTADELARAKILGGTTCEACHGPGSAYGPYKKDHEDYKRADIQKLGLVAPPTPAQCGVCHEKGGCPTMKADYAFDFEKAKASTKDFHEHVPLKKQH